MNEWVPCDLTCAGSRASSARVVLVPPLGSLTHSCLYPMWNSSQWGRTMGRQGGEREGRGGNREGREPEITGNGTLSTAARSTEWVKTLNKYQEFTESIWDESKQCTHPRPPKIGIFKARLLHLSCNFKQQLSHCICFSRLLDTGQTEALVDFTLGHGKSLQAFSHNYTTMCSQSTYKHWWKKNDFIYSQKKGMWMNKMLPVLL